MASLKVTGLLKTVQGVEEELTEPLARFRAELGFAAGLAELHPEREEEWRVLLEEAAVLVTDGLRACQPDVGRLVEEAERILGPIAEVAGEYTVYCAGHAHIDMNWQWPWPETVAVTYDTFLTMDRLMDEFPQFCFSQSQISVYEAMRRYAPEVWERVRKRVEEGRWEVTASQWVEAEKNMASGEIMCRHLLYSRRWLAEHLGLPYEAVKIDWECDTFGHAWTVPTILQRGGVTRYYLHRTSGERYSGHQAGTVSPVFWWEGPEGSRVLVYDDALIGYNNEMGPHMGERLLTYARVTGLKDMLWIYGVGDHGGGPTRRHLRAAMQMQSWPVWPRLKLTTTDEFFSALEEKLGEGDLPVVKAELNFVMEGCYTTQSRIKFANRHGENQCQEAEALGLLGARLGGMEYPRESLRAAWERAMFLQFHDILPGSGVVETREHALGAFQDTLAETGMARTRSLRAVVAKVDTSGLAPAAGGGGEMALGAGAGVGSYWGGVSLPGVGEAGGEVFVVCNPAAFPRRELVKARLWNRELPETGLIARDPAGNAVPAQVTGQGWAHGHRFTEVAFRAEDLPALGYRAYVVEEGQAPPLEDPAAARETGREIYKLGYMGALVANPVVLENEHLKVTVSAEAGGITSLVDKESEEELVPKGEVLGGLAWELEAPHAHAAWLLGPIVERGRPLEGSVPRIVQQGPQVAAVELTRRYRDSDYRLTVSLAAGSRQLDFDLEVDWQERGGPEIGVPTLRAEFPLALGGSSAHFEIPCGVIERPTDGEEVPALNWADLTGETRSGRVMGATLVNDSKYGHRASPNELKLTLVRTSYDPDPLSDFGRQQVRCGLILHDGGFEATAASRAGYAFNHPVIPVGAPVQAGELPPEASFVEVLTPGVMLSGLKPAEEGTGLIVRLYEVGGKDREAEVRIAEGLVKPEAPAVETDVMEQPLAESKARMEAGVLRVQVPARGLVTVRVG